MLSHPTRDVFTGARFSARYFHFLAKARSRFFYCLLSFLIFLFFYPIAGPPNFLGVEPLR